MGDLFVVRDEQTVQPPIDCEALLLNTGAYIKVHRIDPDRTIPDGLATRRLRHHVDLSSHRGMAYSMRSPPVEPGAPQGAGPLDRHPEGQGDTNQAASPLT
jgi:hypothetical protein